MASNMRIIDNVRGERGKDRGVLFALRSSPAPEDATNLLDTCSRSLKGVVLASRRSNIPETRQDDNIEPIDLFKDRFTSLPE
ncbi:MAG: hypothetical protein H6545_05940 [Bacteroidales bacterium]|nr:hypothetical protein [Bacteroidales bacterium]